MEYAKLHSHYVLQTINEMNNISRTRLYGTSIDRWIRRRRKFIFERFVNGMHYMPVMWQLMNALNISEQNHEQNKHRKYDIPFERFDLFWWSEYHSKHLKKMFKKYTILCKKKTWIFVIFYHYWVKYSCFFLKLNSESISFRSFRMIRKTHVFINMIPFDSEIYVFL